MPYRVCKIVAALSVLLLFSSISTSAAKGASAAVSASPQDRPGDATSEADRTSQHGAAGASKLHSLKRQIITLVDDAIDSLKQAVESSESPALQAPISLFLCCHGRGLPATTRGGWCRLPISVDPSEICVPGPTCVAAASPGYNATCSADFTATAAPGAAGLQ